MNWEDLDWKTRECMRVMGEFSPTVRAESREVKGNLVDKYGCGESAYYSADELRELAGACIEVAEWLDKRASAQ